MKSICYHELTNVYKCISIYWLIDEELLVTGLNEQYKIVLL